MTVNTTATWAWPAYLDALPRTSVLSSTQKKALAVWMNSPTPVPLQHPTLSAELKQMLRELMAPAATVFEFCGYDDLSKHAYACGALLLKEMHLRQTPVWAWDEAAWLEIVGVTKKDFTVRHHLFQEDQYIRAVNLRPYAMTMAYLLGEVPIFERIRDCHIAIAAQRIFGSREIDNAFALIQTELKRVGRSPDAKKEGLKSCVYRMLLLRRSPLLTDLTLPIVEQVKQSALPVKSLEWGCIVASKALHGLGILSESLTFARGPRKVMFGVDDSLSPVWITAIQRWVASVRSEKNTLLGHCNLIAKAGRWAAETYPQTADPAQWTPEMATAFVQAVEQMTTGQWNHPKFTCPTHQIGKPMAAGSKALLLNVIRRFFADSQRSAILPYAFNPTEWLKTSPAIKKACVPKPRIIACDVWDKLIEAGLALTADDLPIPCPSSRGTAGEPYYPLAMVRAVAAVWLFSGLRNDEIQRLQVGCIRTPVFGDDYLLEEESTPEVISILRVPVNKTTGEFEKPVDRRLGQLIEEWEKCRPRTYKQLDDKTGERVHFLFTWRGERLGPAYINKTLIPLLCRKAQIPAYDAGGAIKSHRARSTNATRLYERYMNIYELMKWLGHTSLRSTQYYVNISLKALCASYRKAVSTAPLARPLNGTHNYEAQFDTDLLQLWEYAEQDIGPDVDELAGLRPQPKKGKHSPVITLRNRLLSFQENATLDPEERQMLIGTINLLSQYGMRA